MFSLASGIYQSYFAPPKLSILIIGLDGSGKTSLLERIKVTNINTRLDSVAVAAADGRAASLPSSYAKGGAIAGVGSTNTNGSAGNDHHQQPQSLQPTRGGRQQQLIDNAGKPARLPPPLPPKQAMKSAQWVEKVVQAGFIKEGNDQEDDTYSSETGSSKLLSSVPPPPLLVSSGNSDMSSSVTEEGNSNANINTKDGRNKPLLHNNNKKPPLPPRHDSIKKTFAAAAASSSNNDSDDGSSSVVLETAPTTRKKKSSFMGLLRCPSPASYRNSALGEEEDEEEFLDSNNNSASRKEALEPWNTEYLKDYYINYVEEDEFDVKVAPQRGGGGAGGSGSGSGKGGLGGSGSGGKKKMFPLDRIRPTLGQNLAKLDLCGCKCSLFDLSGAEKMRPLWDRYYRDTDAIIYVVNAAETSFTNLHQSRLEYEKMMQNDAIQRRVRCGLPILILANQLDVTYGEYEASLQRANDEKNGRGISWNEDEEDDFVGGASSSTTTTKDGEGDNNDGGDSRDITKRVVDFHDLATLFGFKKRSIISSDDDERQDNHNSNIISNNSMAHSAGLRNVFLFGGSAKSGEGVRAAMEYLVAHAKSYHLARNARR